MMLRLTRKLLAIGLLLSALNVFCGEVNTDILQKAQVSLDEAISAQESLLSSIAQKRTQLSLRLEEAEQIFLDQAQVFEISQKKNARLAEQLHALEADEGRLKAEWNFMTARLSRYLYDVEASMHASELDLFSKEIEQLAENRMQRGISSVLDFSFFDRSIQHLDEKVGSFRFAGKAADENDMLRQGTFLLVGPIEFFAADDSSVAGGVFESNSLVPSVSLLPGASVGELSNAITSGEGLFYWDASNGKALEAYQQNKSLISHVQKGGLWVYPILFGALIIIFVGGFKVWQLYRIRLPKKGRIHELLSLSRSHQTEEALAIARKMHQPAGSVMEVALMHSDEPTELVEEIIYENILSHQPVLERGLSAISMTAATAPLMGLLGTVTGMIHTFELLEMYGTKDPHILSQGISEALVTTELGLVVAIPALILYGLLSRKAHSVLSNLEKISIIYINGLKVSPRRTKEKKKGALV